MALPALDSSTPCVCLSCTGKGVDASNMVKQKGWRVREAREVRVVQ